MNNLLTNGDFELGNTGFSSSYSYDQPDGTIYTGPGQYSITKHIHSDFKNGYIDFGDHTTGSGNMLLVDGSNGGSFWSQSISLAANTTYAFSYYVTSPEANDPNSPVIQFSVDGNAIGTGVTVPQTTGATPAWQLVTQLFTTGAAGNHVIALSDQVGVSQGNDAVFDDLSLQVTSSPADLIVSAAFLDKTSVAAGGTLSVSYQISNQGGGNAGSSTSQVYLSTDATITSADTLLGSLNDVALTPGTSISDNLGVTIPGNLSPGTYYIGVIADAKGTVAEGNEGNNTSSPLQITVTAPATPAPAVTISTVAGDDVINLAESKAGVAVTGTTTNIADGGIVNIVLRDAGGNIIDRENATVTANAFSVSLQSTALHDGTATVTAYASNASGGAPEVSRTLTIDLTPPTVSLAQANVSVSGGTDHVQLIGFVEANAGTHVEIFDGSTDLGSATVTSQATSAGRGWSFVTDFSSGSHSLHAVATDSAGNTTSSAAAPSVSGDTATFAFSFTAAHISEYTGGVQVASPDYTVTANLSGINHFVFTDGTVNEHSGSALVDDIFYFSHNLDVWNAHVDATAHYNQYGWHEGRNPDALFSTNGYLAANRDIAALGLNPLAHYDQYGWKEGRDPSAAFDNEQYLLHNPDVKAAGLDPLAHYLQYGQAEGRQTYAAIGRTADFTHGSFDAEYYLLANADIAKLALASGGDTFAFAYQHYVNYGAQEGRKADAFFDSTYYLAHNPDVAAAHLNPLTHYDQYGWKEGRDPSAEFHSSAYLTANPDVAAAHLDPLTHYLQYGANEGRHLA